MPNFVSYRRCSTQVQFDSSLGLEAQKAAIDYHISRTGGTLLRDFLEVESGGNNDRVLLHEALNLCKLTGSTLIVKALDRYARDVGMVVDLMKSGINFVVTDMPDCSPLTLHLMASISEWERKAISARTKVALQAARERGTVLGAMGKYNLTEEARCKGRLEATKKNQANADDFARRIEPILRDCQSRNMTLSDTAKHLMQLQVKSANGGVKWHPSGVSNILKRLGGTP
jgi:DNA invertase Pin-like site-specific DNA recombinase